MVPFHLFISAVDKYESFNFHSHLVQDLLLFGATLALRLPLLVANGIQM